MEQLLRFVAQREHNQVCRLRKALYSLKQSLRELGLGILVMMFYDMACIVASMIILYSLFHLPVAKYY